MNDTMYFPVVWAMTHTELPGLIHLCPTPEREETLCGFVKMHPPPRKRYELKDARGECKVCKHLANPDPEDPDFED